VGYERKDAHYRRAKAAGFRARSAYKLIELDQRFGLLRPGDRVVDLGAWPGAWMQVALERVGAKGRVVGVDLVEPAPLPGADLVVGDVRDPAALSAAVARLGGLATVVLCDVAPKLTGIRAADEARAEKLVDAVLCALPALLRPGGRLLVKLFMGSSHEDVMRRLRSHFASVRTTRPEASRRGSSELYAIGVGFRTGCG
jgi:23S rRNA (uridine2552-2'-O)-methyltransferase